MTKNRHLVLKGKRVLLRYPEPKDADEYIDLARSSIRFHRGLMRMPRTADEFARFIDRSRREDTECLLICRRTDGAIAGQITLSQIFHGPLCNAYLGYGLGLGFTGNGYATEAVKLIVRHAFGTLKLHRLEANIQPDNLPSIAVARRCGFSKEGFSPKYLKIGGKWRDHERWALIKENWTANR